MVLNLVGGVCGLFILCDLGLGLANGRLNRSVLATQSQFNQAQKVHTTVENLVLRLAQLGKTDPALRDLLARHDVKLTRSTNLPPKRSP
jgi:hypothetical protein